MESTPLQNVVNALVDEQKRIYAQLAARKSKAPAAGQPTGPSILQEAITKAETMLPESRGDQRPADCDLILSLHLLVLGGSKYIQGFLDLQPGPKGVTVTAVNNVYAMLIQLEGDVQSKQLWKAGSQEDMLDFKWKMAFSAYVVHTLNIREVSLGAFASVKGPMLLSHVNRIISDRKPFESFLETPPRFVSSSKEAALKTACADLYQALQTELPESFKDTQFVYDKAKLLHQIWLNKL